MKVIIFDFEVFAYDTLLGATVIEEDGTKSIFQTWDLDKIRLFYRSNIDSIWVGHNNGHYDNYILQTIVSNDLSDEMTVKKVNDDIIVRGQKPYLTIKLYSYDLIMNHMGSLKSIECFMGKNISETQVDFNLNRRLTDEEKALVESYNRDDLDQTYDDFCEQFGEIKLRFDIINEFNLDLDCLSMTGTRLAEEVLHAKKISGIEHQVQLPKIYDNLQVKNEAVKKFFLEREYATGAQLKQTFCGTEHTIAAGGIHGAKNKYHCKEALYFDVSGYYNLIMILLDLLPRSIPDEYKELYKNMYHEQLRLKGIDDQKRSCYKTILLSVFGAMNNKYCRFYDPYRGDLVRLSGQMYLVDLLEKLEGKVEVVQSNTDGIIAVLKEGHEKQEVIDVINEWQQRTGFVLKLETIYDIYQRDVNCYMYRDKTGYIHTLGEAVKDCGKWEYPFWKDSYNSKEPMIIAESIVEFLMNGHLPEETVKKNERRLRMFQYVCKKQSFDYVEYEETDLETGETSVTPLQHVNRAFAWNEQTKVGMVYKKRSTGKTLKSKVSNLPPSVFVYNHEILTDKTVDELMKKIDYDYYIERAYERIREFVDVPYIRSL